MVRLPDEVSEALRLMTLLLPVIEDCREAEWLQPHHAEQVDKLSAIMRVCVRKGFASGLKRTAHEHRKKN